MSRAVIRKLVTVTDEIHREMGQDIDPPTRRAAAIAVIENPFAGRFVADLGDLMELGAELGGLLGDRAVAALGISPAAVESYGKAALVGTDGELEHAAAILHPKLGAPLRTAVETGRRLGTVVEEARWARSDPRHTARSQGCGLCPQPFRRHGGLGE